MQRTIGRRPVFFAVVVVVSLLLYYPTPSAYRWLPLFTTGLAAFWAIGLALEDLTAPGGPRDPVTRDSSTTSSSPFTPPPPPGARS